MNNEQLNTIEYLKLTDKEKEITKCQATMYIWMFGINNIVYYGRTYEELKAFLLRLETWGTNAKKIVFIHNLSFEFEFLRNIFNFKNVFSRKAHRVIKCELEEYNIEMRCTLYMTNVKLEKLPDVYKLNTVKLVGNMDYSKARHFKTKLTKKEFAYCENDCLVIYEYIKKELEIYETVKDIPLTSTGQVRRELKELVKKDYDYKNTVRKAVNTDGHLYNLLIDRVCRRIYARKLGNG